MKVPVIGIIDYGMGNLYSVNNALEYIGADSFISSDTDRLSQADGLILPGVGAFPDAMDTLRKSGLDEFIKDYAENKPLLGICLGMQLLFDSSCEFRKCSGLGLIHGDIVKLTAYRKSNDYKIPHMGWNSLKEINQSPLTQGIGECPYVYFVHSYQASVADRSELISVSEYGEEITAIVGNGRVFGTQFHPEKSESTGLRILSNFCNNICK